MDQSRFGGLKNWLDNQYLMGKDAYPWKLPEALKLLQQFNGEGGKRNNNKNNKNNKDDMRA